MIFYNVSRSNVALNTGADFLTLIAGATRSLLLMEVDAEGTGTSSTYNEFGIYRVATAGVTGSSPVVPAPTDAPNLTGTTPALAFSGLVYTAWGTQPGLGVLAQNHPVNSNGQRVWWRCLPNLSDAIVVPGGNNAAASLSVRGIAGTGTISLRLKFAEL